MGALVDAPKREIIRQLHNAGMDFDTARYTAGFILALRRLNRLGGKAPEHWRKPMRAHYVNMCAQTIVQQPEEIQGKLEKIMEKLCGTS